MRVLLLSSYFYPHHGGSQRYLEELYAHLIEMDPSIAVDVICYNTDKAKIIEKYRGFTIHRVSCIQILPGQFAIPNYLSVFWTIIKLSQKHSYDIVHSNTRFFDHSWWAPLVARLLRAKAILTDHCASHPVHTSSIITQIARLIDKLATYFSARFYDLVTVTNNSTLKFFESISTKEPILIYGGVDTEFFTPKKRKKIRLIQKVNRKIVNKDIIVTFLGRMIQTKGPQLLYEVARKVVKAYPNVHFVFAGDGEMYQKLNCNTERLYFTGDINKDQITQLLADTDIFVHPSTHHEGFPNVILEAGASGCAVIATNKGGTKELIIHGKTGLLMKPTVINLQSMLKFLLDDANKRKKIGRSLREKIEREFNWKDIAKEYKDLIDHQLFSLSSKITHAYNFQT